MRFGLTDLSILVVRLPAICRRTILPAHQRQVSDTAILLLGKSVRGIVHNGAEVVRLAARLVILVTVVASMLDRIGSWQLPAHKEPKTG